MNAARIDAMPESSVGTQWSSRLSGEIGKAVLGQVQIIERLQIALLTGGHVLLEGMPGLAKTLLVKSLATALGVDFERIQFTPDLLPSDIVGTMVYSPGDGKFTAHHGPIFSNLVLADEINRAPAKVQSALLEAMQERQVTIGGTTHPLPEPFLVMATQNPVEQEGTYPLPEAQLDRFLFKLLLDYPSQEDEIHMVRRWGKVTSHPELGSVSQRRRAARAAPAGGRRACCRIDPGLHRDARACDAYAAADSGRQWEAAAGASSPTAHRLAPVSACSRPARPSPGCVAWIS